MKDLNVKTYDELLEFMRQNPDDKRTKELSDLFKVFVGEDEKNEE